MIKSSRVFEILGVCILLFQTSNAYSYEGSLEANIGARAVYNDNIFLTAGPHDAVTGIMITPTLSGIIKEQHWQAKLDARIKSQTYSDHTLDGNDQFFSLTGQYSQERNIFSLNVTHDFGSNLNSTATDFGIVGRRINTNNQRIAPQYTRLITERLALTLSYVYTDVDFEDAENTSYTPYLTETGSASLMYELTEKDRFTISLQGVDYNSRNDLITYRLFTSRAGVEHKFSETLSTNFSVGISRLNSTNLTTQPLVINGQPVFDINGQLVTVVQEVDFETRGSVYDAGITQLLESGRIGGRISRNIKSNSFGGLDRVDQLKLNYSKNISSLWRYAINTRYEDISSSNSGSGSLSRNLFFFESSVYYSISRDWNVNAAYLYAARKYKRDTSEDRAPHSNRLYVGLSYNFPSLSTY